MKTKMNIKSIILIAIICISSLFFINMSFAANTAKIKVETANLRQEPSSESKILELASQGEEVEILEKSGDWYKVKYKKITGYLRSDLIEVKETTSNSNNTNETVEANTQTQETSTEAQQTENVQTTNTNEIQIGKATISAETALKIVPLINSLEIKTLKENEQVEVVNVMNEWICVTTSEGTQGWVRKEKIAQQSVTTPESTQTTQTQNTTAQTTADTNTTQQTKKMYVNSQTINVREKADKTSTVITQLSINTEVTVLSTDNGWSYVEVNGKKGYISSSLLSATKQQETSRSAMNERTTNKTSNTTASAEAAKTTTTSTSKTAEVSTASSSKGSEVVAYAKTLLGCKYVYGGTTTSGFDCSGFTQYVYKHFGINLNRTASAQYSNGQKVTNLQAGDLVMFGKSGINHVGIYIGGNTFIHAANPSRGVTTDSLSSGYYKTNYVGARRIF